MFHKKNRVLIVSTNPQLSESLATWLRVEKLKPTRLGDVRLLDLMRTNDLACVVIDTSCASVQEIAAEAAKTPVLAIYADAPLHTVQTLHEAGVCRCINITKSTREIAQEAAKIVKGSPLRCKEQYQIKDLLEAARGRLLTRGIA